MKAYIFNRRPDKTVSQPPCFTLVPASAYVPSGRPVFVPDFASSWVAQPLIALRICRLGKGIAVKFASRYYDALTLGAMLIPRDLKQKMMADALPAGLLGSFDGCLQLGPWMPLPQSDFVAGCNGTAISISPESLAAGQTVSMLSQYLTLKQGDVIAPVVLPVSLDVSPGVTLSLTLDGTPLTEVRYR